MGRAGRSPRLVAAGLLVWLLGVGDAMACMPPPLINWLPRLLADSPVIFSATVAEVVDPQGDLARFEVTQRWRGETEATVVLGERGNPSCRPRRFQPGERVIVFAEQALQPGANRIGLFRILDDPPAGSPVRTGLEALLR